MAEHWILGKPIPRHDAWSKVDGSIRYAGDYAVPEMLHARVFRSPFPSARILSVDTSAAEGLVGVHAVITGRTFPYRIPSDIPGQSAGTGQTWATAPVLAAERVNFVGEAVALVAADTPELADAALNLIHIEWQEEPGIFDPLQAIRDSNNIIAHYGYHTGDVDSGFAEADLVIENTFRLPCLDHACLELEDGLAWIDEHGVINVRIGTQGVEHFRTVADALGVPHANIRIAGTMVGGAFGGKGDATLEIYLALLASRTRRPVHLGYSREESFLARCKRHPYIMRYKTGAQRDGRMVALEVELIADAGAYATMSPYVALYSAITATGPYVIPNVKVNAVAVHTNNPISGAMRGFGVPQACFACECQMDALAAALGMDPLVLREINYVRKGDRLATRQTIETEPLLSETARRACEALGKRTEPSARNKRVGRGIASHMTPYGRLAFLHDRSSAHVRMETDGSVVIRSGIPDIGGGQSDSLCQIAAEVLGVSPRCVTILTTDSLMTPLAGMTRGSRQVFMSGNAVLMAARAIRESLLTKASEMLGVDPGQLDLVAGQVVQNTEAWPMIEIQRVAAACAASHIPLDHLAEYVVPSPADLEDPAAFALGIFQDFTFGAHAAEVEVDLDTGEVRVLKSVGCHDVGKAINPASVAGQIEGGAVMGQGYALSEEYILDHGYPRNASFQEYMVPFSLDCGDITALLIESGQGKGPFGAKGVGEPALSAVAPAIINAIRDATGVHVLSLPATPARLWNALHGLDQSRTRANGTSLSMEG